ncbi:MAG: archease [Cyclobacteriaceae bacterium]|jgi:SHS2 domain-containing protein|nr:archease [Cyclobacteriaceae bacterium]
MKNVEFISHAADVRIRITADTMEELFEAGMEAIAVLLHEGRCRQEGVLRSVRETVAVESPDVTSLLVDFLSEVLTYSQNGKAVFCGVEFEELTDVRLQARIYGIPADEFLEDIKGVTCHEAGIMRNDRHQLETLLVLSR